VGVEVPPQAEQRDRRVLPMARAHGSRRLPESVIVRPKQLYRRIISGAFRRAIPILAGTPRSLSDTQCGFKMYRGTVAWELYSQCLCHGFLFDVEVILRAVAAGYRIREFPVEWRSDPDSRLHAARSIPKLLRELVAIRRALRK